MLEALALAACLAGGFAEPPARLALAAYVSCEPEIVIVGEAEPELIEPEPESEQPERVWLGVDCNPGVDANGDEVAYAVSLPDDVLTECE